MFYELHRDINVLHGGLWFDPDQDEFVEVIDMDSAAGDKGLTLIIKGSRYIDENKLRTALENAGHFTPQAPPKPPTGVHEWSPRHFEPRPKPGYLFWVGEPIRGPRIMKAWEEWSDLRGEGEDFRSLPEEAQGDVLIGAEAIHSYYGTEDSETREVIERQYAKRYKKQFPDAVISDDPEEAVWEILGKMDIEWY